MALIVNEIFHSIQGESLYSGLPCVFIRLSGCNLRCSYCDTRYAYNAGCEMSVDDILKSIKPFLCPIVEITGGEPLAQNATPHLVKTLLNCSYTVLLETNGSISVGEIDNRCIKIIDIKCPSSGESHNNHYENIGRLNPTDQLKFVIQNKTDYEFTKKILGQYDPPVKLSNILLSPVSGALTLDCLARWILDDGLNVRLHTQFHKLIWPGIDRGV